MRSREEVKRDFVRQWLAKADEDLGVADLLLSGKVPFLSAIGFHSLQAAEKFLKAVLTHHQIEFPKTLNLSNLLDLISVADSQLAESLREITVLNSYGAGARDPGRFPAMTLLDAKQAVELTSKIRTSVRSALRDYSGDAE